MSIKKLDFFITKRKKQEVQIKKMEKFNDYRKLIFSSLLKNGNKKFKNKIIRSSTFKNRALPNSYKGIKKIRFKIHKKTQTFSHNREKFRFITVRSSRTTRCAFCIKKNKIAKSKSFVVISSSHPSEKVQKLL